LSEFVLVFLAFTIIIDAICIMKETIVISTKRPTEVKGLKYQLHSGKSSQIIFYYT